jgi:ATP-binding cassette subfamily B protein
MVDPSVKGAGTTTLVKLLLGLCRPTAGRIVADAVDDAELVLSSVHDRVAAAFQEFFNFQLTAVQSIAPGRPAAFGGAEGIRPDLAQVERAARLDGADGYATPVGHELHGGQGLSGGQRPRLAVSRTFMRDAHMLILDEPTAALDPRAEAEVHARFNLNFAMAAPAGREAPIMSRSRQSRGA